MALTRQHAETSVTELVGHVCRQLLAVPGGSSDEVVALYLLANEVWYRMFIDAGLFFLDEAAPDPEDDLDEGVSYVDLAAKLKCVGDAIQDLSMTDSTLRLQFRSGVSCVIRETDGHVRVATQS